MIVRTLSNLILGNFGSTPRILWRWRSNVELGSGPESRSPSFEMFGGCVVLVEGWVTISQCELIASSVFCLVGIAS